MSFVLEIIFTALFLAVLVWGGDSLLKLFPGNEKLKQIVRIVAIVAVALLFLNMVASFLGVSMPWGTGLQIHRHR
jgi:Mg2+ and Co2+ transporter CorA